MLSAAGGLFSRTLEAADNSHLKELFSVTASSYWDDHFVFGKKSKFVSKSTGTQATDIFLINAVIPILFTYGRFHENHDICEKALTFLENIDPETNSIIRDWKSAEIEMESAFYTQALLQLTDEYCRKRRCLECRVGCKIISMGKRLINSNELILEP